MEKGQISKKHFSIGLNTMVVCMKYLWNYKKLKVIGICVFQKDH